MRWKAKMGPRIGEERVITKFLWLPLCINGEWRWLERARIRQLYCTCYVPYNPLDISLEKEIEFWENVEWVDSCNHDWHTFYKPGAKNDDTDCWIKCERCGKEERRRLA